MTFQGELILELEDVGLTYREIGALLRRHEYQALKSVDLQVRRGETLGIVGRNGSGKSTLLKVIAGVFKPDTGRVIRHAQKISLLSLGVGFDPSLSGRDNAIILGMFLGGRRAEVVSKLEEILEFSELGNFANQPLKTYSSGMRSRLGFSVAVTMHADLMLVDEVLSVGDAGFKAKAEAAMRNKITSEQSVILISHSLDQVKRLSDRVAWLHDGKIEAIGEPDSVIERYLDSVNCQKQSAL